MKGSSNSLSAKLDARRANKMWDKIEEKWGKRDLLDRNSARGVLSPWGGVGGGGGGGGGCRASMVTQGGKGSDSKNSLGL